ncbi:Hint domain-containing protein [Pseudooceanicola sp.]|uniref:Hint domain-containing protein n=1 Tax=Pseudooceanicola sp. TaxID=1914328 RepID=UPI00262F4589|nr:Hint domain-containing protein [Pseudooceanicola sp.]MDF1854764.1 Hint domain-containing protein [Pseudooceanicola sp.]
MKPITVKHINDNATPRATINGFVAGTKVLTLDGELPVEFLNTGDRVITRDSGMAVIRNIRTHKTRTAAISIAAGSLGHTRPDADMVLPADQKVLVRDWRAEALFGEKQALVPISRLVDGQYVRALGEVELTVYELEFDADHVIYAGGMELEAEARVTEDA